MILHWPEFHGKTAARRLRLMTETAAVRAQNRARDIQPESERVRARLEGAEQVFGAGNSRAGVAEAHDDQIALDRRGNAHLALPAILERLLAVARQIDENLQEAVMV